jgi:hypothetical protein
VQAERSGAKKRSIGHKKNAEPSRSSWPGSSVALRRSERHVRSNVLRRHEDVRPRSVGNVRSGLVTNN